MSSPKPTESDLKSLVAAQNLVAARRMTERYGDLPATIFKCVEKRRDEGQSIDDGLFEDVAGELSVSSWSLCRKLYYRYKKLVDPNQPPPPSELPVAAPPAGRQMFLLQKWGASSAEARDLVARLHSAAGSLRAAHVDRLFNRMESRREWDGRRRIAWLKHQARKMASDPVYWPASRPPRDITGADLVIKVLREEPGNRATKATLIRKTGKSPNSIATLTAVLVRDGDILRLKPGLYALPQAGATQNLWRPAREEILSALAAAPSNKATIAELIGITGRKRNTLYTATCRLVDARRLICVQRGVFALPPPAQKKFISP